MWTARIAILVTMLLTAGGWFDSLLPRWKKATVLLLLPGLFALSYVPTLREPVVRLCCAPCALALFCALLCPTKHPFGALTAAALGGMIGWKLCDTLPLFPEQGLLIAVPTLATAALYCRDRSAKTLAIAAAPFFMLLLRAFGDYALFQSAVLELGDADALTAQTTGMLAILLTETVLHAGKRRKERARTRALPADTRG